MDEYSPQECPAAFRDGLIHLIQIQSGWEMGPRRHHGLGVAFWLTQCCYLSADAVLLPSLPQFPMGPGSDGPMGGMGGMEPHHMNGSLGERPPRASGSPRGCPAEWGLWRGAGLWLHLQ